MYSKFQTFVSTKSECLVLAAVWLIAAGCADSFQEPTSSSESGVTTRGQAVKASTSHKFSEAPSGTTDWDVNAVEVGPSGEVYVAGTISPGGELDFGGPVMANPSTSDEDAFLIKYDSSGTPQWQRHYHSDTKRTDEYGNTQQTHTYRPVDLAITPQGNLVYAGFQAKRPADKTVYYGYGYLRQLSPSGTSQWTQAIGPEYAPSEPQPRVTSIAVGPNNQLVVAGEHIEEFSNGAGGGTVTPRNTGSNTVEGYMITYGPNRNHDWHFSFGGEGKTRVTDVAKNRTSGTYSGAIAVIGHYNLEHSHYRQSGSRPTAPTSDDDTNLFLQTIGAGGTSIADLADNGDQHSSWPHDSYSDTRVTFDGQGRLYIAGSFMGRIDGQYLSGSAIISNNQTLATEQNEADRDVFLIGYPHAADLGKDNFAYASELNKSNSTYNVEDAYGLDAGSGWVALSGEAEGQALSEGGSSTEDDGFTQVFDTSSVADFPSYLKDYTLAYTNNSSETSGVYDVAINDSNTMALGGENSKTNYSLGGNTLPGGRGFFVSYEVN